MMKRIIQYMLLALSLFSFRIFAEGIKTTVAFTTPDDLYCILQDHHGLIWVGSSAGLYSYDGYELCDWRGGGRAQMATGVIRLAEDSIGNLWVGTRDGLVRIDPQTGHTSSYRLPKQSQQVIFALFTSSDGTIYAGTDDGFSVYRTEVDSFQHFNSDNTIATFADGRHDTVWSMSVKDFVELPNGDILIGTWAGGLLRYTPRRQTFRAYNRLNPMNSAFSLCLDDNGRVWIGTWATGIQCISNADDYALKTLQTVRPSSSSIRQLCISPIDGEVRWTSDNERRLLPSRDGRLWVLHAKKLILEQSNNHPFHYQPTGRSVRSLYVTDKGQVITDNSEEGITVFDILQHKNGDLLMAAEEAGIHVVHPNGNKEVWHHGNHPWLKDSPYAFCETRDGILWVGQRMGLSVVKPGGEGQHLDIKTDSIDLTGYFIVNHIMEDHIGRIWVSSSNGGIVSVSPSNLKAHLSIKHFLGTSNITSCFEDSKHRLWAISSTDGLLYYNSEKDIFEKVVAQYHLPTHKIYAINEDGDGILWLGTDRSLIRLEILANGEAIVSSFTEEDGLPHLSFMPRATFRHGDTLYFGITDGYICFNPAILNSQLSNGKLFNFPIVVTDILIDGTSLSDLDSTYATRICADLPSGARTLTIPPSVKKFSVEFALLSYSHTAQTQYSYRLDGHDDDWQFCDPGQRRATFSNLPSGNYTLHLRAADSNGQWTELPYTIVIRILPPWYSTWWAYIIYICLLCAISWFIWRYLQMQREVQASRRFTAIMNSVEKAEAVSETSVIPQKQTAFLTRARELVLAHLDDSEYNRDRMAADMGMSASSLFSKLREVTGMNIQTFIQNIRLNAAADILRQEPDIRISELAYRVGFNTPKYFSQCFKKEFGVLPGEYIQQ